MSLKYAILGILSIHPMYGYKIKKNFDRAIAYNWNANDGQIYPELKKMEKEYLIKSKVIHQTAKPNKKVYSISEKGQALLDEWLQQPTKKRFVKDEFLLKLFFFHRIEPTKRLQLLAQEKETTESLIAYGKIQIEKYREIECSSIPEALKWQIQVAAGLVKEYETHKNWLEEMIAMCEKEFDKEPSVSEENLSLSKIFS